jgi:arylformamidase
VSPLLDISLPVHPGMVVYPGDPEVRVDLVRSLVRGDDADMSRLDLGAHTGTHVDAPRHFIVDAPGADALSVDVLIGPAWVCDATGVQGDVDLAALDALDVPPGTERVLFRTGNSWLWARQTFSPEFAAVAPDAAAALVERGVRLVGVDYLSVGSHETHRTLLGAGVVVVEGLDLRRAPTGPCRLICLPLRLVGADGAPARALLEIGR